MDEDVKKQLIAQFCEFLEKETVNLPDSQPIDLFSVFTELSGLHNEVKRESRQVKQALEQFREVFELLRVNQIHLEQQIQQVALAHHQQYRQEMRQFLLEWLELYDRLVASAQWSIPLNKWKLTFCRCQTHIHAMQRLQEGQMMTVQRLLETLNRYQVHSLEVMGQPFNPRYMKAIAVDNVAGVDEGLVIAELRKGFTWKGEVLRWAEVKVNKLQGCSKID